MVRCTDIENMHIPSTVFCMSDSKKMTSFETLAVSDSWIRVTHQIYRKRIANYARIVIRLFFILY